MVPGRRSDSLRTVSISISGWAIPQHLLYIQGHNQHLEGHRCSATCALNVFRERRTLRCRASFESRSCGGPSKQRSELQRCRGDVIYNKEIIQRTIPFGLSEISLRSKPRRTSASWMDA
jgi:hypothetical protein